MTVSLSQLLEDSFQIAWEYLERSGELGDGASASRFLSDVIEAMIRRGQRSRLALSNRFRPLPSREKTPLFAKGPRQTGPRGRGPFRVNTSEKSQHSQN